jgi:GNAT superfamily N-acetyltransferase
VKTAQEIMGERDDRFWAGFLGIAADDWKTAGVSVRAHVGLVGYDGLWSFGHREHTVLSVPPGWVAQLAGRVQGRRHDELLEAAVLREMLGADLERVIGPVFQGSLEPGRFRPRRLPGVRAVGAADAAALDEFRAACGPDGWETGGLEEAAERRMACFEGGRIVAMAGYRAWTHEAGDPCVLTHPEFRGRGFGAAVVGAVVEGALAAGKVLLYQTLEENRPAVGLALRLGYEPYARHLAARLKADSPSTVPLPRP